jgi:DNA-binding MarR family transcriptional regulator
MTALLDRMEEKHLLRREMDAQDRRSVRIFLTADGQSYRQQVEAVAAQLSHLVDTLITPQQMETFHYVLGVLQNIQIPQIT